MNKHVKISLIVLVTVVLLLALTVPGLAKKPDKFFTLEFDFEAEDINWDNYTADDGDYESTGAIEDEGSVSGHFIPSWGIFRGTTIFVSDFDGDKFVIRWHTGDRDETGCAYGQFQIYGYLGTGDYEGVWGSGRITLCRPIGGDSLSGSLEGFAIYP